MKNIFIWLVCLAVYLLFSVNRAIASDGITWSVKGDEAKIYIDWCSAYSPLIPSASGCSPVPKGNESRLDDVAITEDVAVKVRVDNFNFIHFDLKLETEEKVIESYVYLNDLWNPLLGFPSGLLASRAAVGRASPDPLVSWWKLLKNKNKELLDIVSSYNSSSLLDAELRGSLGLDIAKVKSFKSVLELSREAALNSIISKDEADLIEVFERLEQQHVLLIQSSRGFLSLAQKSLAGHQFNIGKKSAGTQVTVFLTIQPHDTAVDGRNLKPVKFDYFSHSKLPLLFHAGLTYNSLKDSDFETVQSLSGADLFTQIREESGAANLSIFASYALDSKSPSSADWFLTLGTDVADIGDNIYVGVTHKVKDKWMLSIGGAYGLQAQGENPVMEPSMESSSPSVDLFQIVKEERDWELFIGISYSIF